VVLRSLPLVLVLLQLLLQASAQPPVQPLSFAF
jgi:hypothetical protein